ncbi:MFS transporter [Deinococcus maricopensis]|uniref:Major facilitator superfamily MFS_1 n=1 Tax=Deinococcus maricopensis (strain DSM 21211 / LMG 22137 / NRRL B-23946 / LB-34) TaxID=709986 RepID=E8UBE0_DEIML|nr:MFS transporter [Deinococcus maricopensis]ADV68379.1 major facilitator superfamily MFS_1 [Deinococcus maricopensis DSM 21211]
MTHTTHPTPALHAHHATWLVFFLCGVLYASWVVHIPAVSARLHLTPALLGSLLLLIAVGSLLSMTLAGHLTARHGSAATTRAFALISALLLLPPLIAPDAVTLGLALFAFGFANGGLDVAMNAQGVTVERTLQRPTLSGYHAGYSLGNLAGAGLGSLLISAGVTAVPHALSVSVVMLALALLTGPRLLRHDQRSADAAQQGPAARLSPALLLTGLLCLLGMLGEGAMADWSGLYYQQVLHAPAALTGLGFIAFTCTMTLGRVFGDRLRAQLGDLTVVRGGALIAGVGLGAALLTRDPVLTALGFAAFGVGAANVVPALYGAAGHVGGGPGIARVATLGYLGFLAGPPLLGFVAQGTSLPVALALVAGAALIIAGLSGRALQPAA